MSESYPSQSDFCDYCGQSALTILVEEELSFVCFDCMNTVLGDEILDNNNPHLRRIYEIVPQDALYQVEGEDHRTPLSEEEIEFVVEYCVQNDFDQEQTIVVLRQLELARISSIICERFLKKELDIEYLNADNDIIWRAKPLQGDDSDA